MNVNLRPILYICIIAVILLGCFGIGGLASAAFNEQINFQGKLTDNNNVAVPDGTYNIEFKLYATSSGGSALWTETATGTNRISVTSGLFSHLLGSVTALSDDIFNQTLWLGVNIGGTTTSPVWDGEMAPRKKLGAVPAAFESKRLSGKLESAFATLAENETVTGIWNFTTSTASTTLTVRQDGSGNIVDFKDGANSVFVIADGGNVGVGTTTPAYTLDVYGTLRSVSTSTFSGNVGIGTMAPNDKLEISDNAGGLRLSYASQPSVYNLQLNTVVTAGVVGYSFDQRNNDVDYNNVLVLDRGNVGIGTTGPNRKLVLYEGDFQITNNAMGATSTDGFIIGPDINSNMQILNFENTAIRFFTNGSANERVRIDNTGNVGIGTSTPATTFQVYGASTFMGGNVGIGTTAPGAKLYIASAGGTDIQVNDAGSNVFKITGGSQPSILFGGSTRLDDSAIAGSIGTYSAKPFGLYANSAEIVRITSAGNVGIGTTTPAYTLDVYGSARLGSSTASNLYFRGLSNFNNNFYIDTSGNVATGTWQGTPVGTAYGGTGTSTSNWTGYAYLTNGVWATSSSGILSGGQANYIPYWTSATAQSTSTLYFDGSNIGIGTTTPSALLDVWASSTASALTVFQNGTGTIVDLRSTGSSVFTLKSADQLKYRSGLVQTFGTFNDKIIDDFEDNNVTNWTSSDNTNTKVSATTTQFKVNDYGFAITTAVNGSGNDTATTSVASEDWSSYERLGFWVRADYTSTSTDATTTQMISAQFASSTSAQTYNITIKEPNQWQYEEWDISGISGRTGITRFGFRVDYDYGSPRFYIDHIRLYDQDLQTGEMFVDAKGNLVVWGQKGVEIGRTSAGVGSLPSVSVEQAVVQINQPLSVNTGGDVGMSYDLAFTNTGLSSITSEGPLRIAAGDSNHYENLTLTTAGTGDVLIEIASSTVGFKVLGSDSGNYVFRVSPTGDVEIGGTGSGGSDLTVKQNLTLLGGNITINQLATTAAPTLSTTTSGFFSANTYYYRITAANDNGQTTGSATSAQVVAANQAVVVSWTAVSGAAKHYIWRSVDNDWADNDDYRIEVLAPNDSYTDTGTSTQATSTFPTSNTTGGALNVAGNILPSTTTADSVAQGTATTSAYSLGAATAKWLGVYVVNQYVGDIIFNNQFRITEAMATSSPEKLIFMNASSSPIMAIDENGNLTVNKLTAKEVETEKMKIRDSDASKTGITIYDRATSEPYCIYVESGEMKSAAGECSATSTVASTSASVGETSSSTEVGPLPTPAPSPGPGTSPESSPTSEPSPGPSPSPEITPAPPSGPSPEPGPEPSLSPIPEPTPSAALNPEPATTPTPVEATSTEP